MATKEDFDAILKGAQEKMFEIEEDIEKLRNYPAGSDYGDEVVDENKAVPAKAQFSLAARYLSEETITEAM